MVSDVLSTILDELSKILHMKLKPDRNNSCLLPLPGGGKAQIELDKEGENLVIGIEVGAVPVGAYRQNLFKEALMANGMPSPRHGVFAFSPVKEVLILYELIPAREASSDKVMLALTPLTTKANVWRLAIEQGEIPPREIEGVTTSSSRRGGGGMFGLR